MQCHSAPIIKLIYYLVILVDNIDDKNKCGQLNIILIKLVKKICSFL